MPVANNAKSPNPGFDPLPSGLEIEARFQAVVETILDGIITIDEFGTIDFLNAAAEQMFGYRREELIGQNISRLMPAPYAVQHDGYLRNYLQTGVANIIGVGRQVTGLRADGTTFFLELSVTEVRTQGRRLFTGVVRDITERLRIEQRLAEAEKTAFAANEAKTMFLRSMSHDLRTPLTPIIGHAELLLETELDADQREGVEAILRNSEIMLAMVSRLLDAVIEHEQQQPVELSTEAPAVDRQDLAIVPQARLGESLENRVLIAEDTPENQRLLQQILARKGIQSVIVSNGHDAVTEALLASNDGQPYGLILMDVQMPILNGWDATRQLRALGVETPIVAITALALPNDILECLQSGCQEVLKKPIKIGQLDDVLARYLVSAPVWSSSGKAVPIPEEEFR